MPVISTSVKREETSVSARLPGKDVDQAVAISMAEGPAAGLALTDELAAGGKLAGYHPLRRLGRGNGSDLRLTVKQLEDRGLTYTALATLSIYLSIALRYQP